MASAIATFLDSTLDQSSSAAAAAVMAAHHCIEMPLTAVVKVFEELAHGMEPGGRATPSPFVKNYVLFVFLGIIFLMAAVACCLYPSLTFSSGSSYICLGGQ
jgi:hypothetical protein